MHIYLKFESYNLQPKNLPHKDVGGWTPLTAVYNSVIAYHALCLR